MAESMPLVSVILPTYNRPEYLLAAARTVNQQTYDNIELVVVDDNSKIPAKEVLADADLDALERLTFVRHETNKGANAARNNGLRSADGEFIAFLDDDDRWLPSKIERQVDRFSTSGPETGVVYTWIQYVDADGNEQNTKTGEIRGDVTYALLTGKRVAEFSAVMVRANVIESAGSLDERFPSWQDREWYIRLSEHCEFQPVSELLTVRYMSHGDQISDDFETKRDVSYPLLIEKHRPLAAEYGRLCERRFIGEHSRILGATAVHTGNYGEARSILLRAIRYSPFSLESYLYLLTALGGNHTHRLARRLKPALAWF